MTAIGLTLRQVRYENRAFWRNPAAAFFTFVFPLLFMVIFNVLFGASGPPGRRGADFYTPAIIVFSVINATFTNLAMSVTGARQLGILKRVRGTPLPAGLYLAGRIAHAVLVALLLVVIVAAFGAVFYGVRFPWEHLAALVVVLAVGAACFSALGLALTGFIPNADAAPAIVNAVILPLEFFSNVFIDVRNAPGWVETVSRLFPVRHFADAMLTVWDPRAGGTALSGGDLVVLIAWGAVGVLVALRFFAWEPGHR